MRTSPTAFTPRRRDHSLMWVLLGVVLVGGVLAFSGVYILARYLARQVAVDLRDSERGGKSFSIETPGGSLRMDTGQVSEAQLGMPVYPGARRRNDRGATISVEVPSEKSMFVAAAEFETEDAPDKVAAFYRERLGAGASERRRDGKLEFLVQEGGGKWKVVALRLAGRGTRIGMAHLTEAPTN